MAMHYKTIKTQIKYGIITIACLSAAFATSPANASGTTNAPAPSFIETPTDAWLFHDDFESGDFSPGKFYGINAFYLENYCNNGVTGVQTRYFDNLVISREKIGMASPENKTQQ